MGNFWSIISQAHPPKPTWGVSDIPDLSGKVVLVTGGNSGVGKETVKALLLRGAKVYMTARNVDAAQAVLGELKQQTGKEPIILHLDLADLMSVKRAAEEFMSKENMLHVLFNSAGVMACPISDITRQGLDMQVGTNVVGHFYLTQQLLPALLAVYGSNAKDKARVVILTSSAHYLTASLDHSMFEDGPKRRSKATMDMYSISKFANVVHARELARRYGDQIVTISVNPGNLATGMQRHISKIEKAIYNIVLGLYPASYGALTPLYAGTAPEAANLNGKYLIPWARLGVARPETGDQEAGMKLWSWLEAFCRKV